MAACIPTLPVGYKWLRQQWRQSKQSSSQAHLLPFTEKRRFQPQPSPSPSKPPQVHHHHTEDHDISNALRSLESEPPARPIFPNRIQRTIRVDVERDAAADGDNNSVEDEGKGKGHGKPSIEIDLGPRFEIESLRSLWAGTLDAGAGGRRSREGSEDTLVD